MIINGAFATDVNEVPALAARHQTREAAWKLLS
jgi:hypothetical protein